MGSLIKVIASGCRSLPLINSRCVISSSRALAAAHDQRCLFSTIINDEEGRHHGHGLKHNLQRARNKALNSISNFIYTNIMNRFGLFSERTYCIGLTKIEPSMSETNEYLCYHLQMNGVISHENVRVFVNYNLLFVEGAVYDEFKATPHMYNGHIYLPEDSYYLNYKMRGIKADFSEGGELKLTIPKFDAAERMINEKKDAAGEFLKLKQDAFIFDIKVNVAI